MKKLLIYIVFILTASNGCEEARQIAGQAGSRLPDTGSPSLSEQEVARGLKEALRIGTDSSVSVLSRTGGYLRDPQVRIPFPPEAEKVRDALETLGQEQLVDNIITTINRAAEDAATEAMPIFKDAITSISITDAFNILRGGDHAATEYLRSRTSQRLYNVFQPKIGNSLQKVNATKYWTDAINVYNRIPTTSEEVNPDLPGYVTEKALEGLFVKVAEEEERIRENPVHRVTDLLRKVFDESNQ